MPPRNALPDPSLSRDADTTKSNQLKPVTDTTKPSESILSRSGLGSSPIPQHLEIDVERIQEGRGTRIPRKQTRCRDAGEQKADVGDEVHTGHGDEVEQTPHAEHRGIQPPSSK